MRSGKIFCINLDLKGFGAIGCVLMIKYKGLSVGFLSRKPVFFGELSRSSKYEGRALFCLTKMWPLITILEMEKIKCKELGKGKQIKMLCGKEIGKNIISNADGSNMGH